MELLSLAAHFSRRAHWIVERLLLDLFRVIRRFPRRRDEPAHLSRLRAAALLRRRKSEVCFTARGSGFSERLLCPSHFGSLSKVSVLSAAEAKEIGDEQWESVHEGVRFHVAMLKATRRSCNVGLSAHP
jgi:hypothetical protein